MDSTTLFLATLIIVTLLVLVLVVYLILIIVALRRAGTHLEGLAGGLQKIQDDTEPLGEKVGVINGALGQLHGGLSSVDSHLVAIAKVLKLV
ncbi:MAG: hypothetical protein ACI8YC_000715 [Salibacteraceae bacterium]|jgi:hypothetical protein|tara:strand:+ start:451 stop:726 length:276 start_codon:yes stop_codon:yes gene_type:complete